MVPKGGGGTVRSRVALMKRAAIPTFVAMVGLAAAGHAAWYGGAALGITSYGYGVGSFDDGSITVGSVDDEDTGWKLFGGYRFVPVFGVEVGYVDLQNDFDGSTTFRGTSDGSGTLYRPGGVSVDVSNPSGWYAAAVGRLPMMGAGFEYRILRPLRLRAEWERYVDVAGADVDLISVGLSAGLPFP